MQTAPTPVDEGYPLSALQQGMLFHQRYAPDAGVDIEQMVCTLHEPLDVPALAHAWDSVLARHAALRTAFAWRAHAEPYQWVAAAVTCPLTTTDWRGFPDANARLARYLADDRRAGFDLATPPLLRLALFQCADADYRLVWTFHHAILDGRSFPLVLREVFAFYDAARAGATLTLPTPRPYRDYIHWLTTRDWRASEAYWRDLLHTVEAPTPLPAALTGPAPTDAHERPYGLHELRLSADLTAALVELAQQHDLTLNTLLQGAWALVLARTTRERTVVFGATRAGRRTALDGVGTETMVGLLINTLPVYAEYDPARPLLDWLRALRAQAVAVRAHEHTPLIHVQAWSNVPRGQPLFETLLVFENYLLDQTLRAEGDAWATRTFDLHERVNYPLTLAAYGGHALVLKLEYDRRRCADDAVARLAGHIHTVLAGFVAHPHTTLGALPWLTAPESAQAIRAGHAPAFAPTPETADVWGRSLPQLFAAQVARTPDAVALIDGTHHVTFAALEGYANRIAHSLRARGIGNESPVGLCLPRTWELVASMLGVLKAGGLYVPLDPTYPRARLGLVLEDARAQALITRHDLLDRLPEHDVPMLILDAPDALATQANALPDTPDWAQLAYLIYTSGSTGRPKGVAIEHRNVVAFLHWARGVFGPEWRAGLLASTSINFDLSVFELFLPLCFGGTVILAENALHWPSLPAASAVRLVNTVPSAMAELLRAGALPAGVRVVNVAGEPVPPELVAALYRVPGIEAVYNLYGPSETTTYSTFARMTHAGPVTIGGPIDGTTAYVLDAQGQPTPVDVAGELYIGGAGVARGYLGRPELTAERFVADPFADAPLPHVDSAFPLPRLYRTGDLVRWRADGALDYLGRLDHQVKLRGFRIELGEIEAALRAQSSVAEAVALVRDAGRAEARLVAYVTLRGTTEAADLRHALQASLPPHMVPQAIVVLAALPRTPNGKLDRQALPAPDWGGAARETYVAPRTELEQTIAALWAEVLHLPRVGLHDNFFELGGHSLLAMQAMARVATACGGEWSVRVLFDAPTVAALAARINAERGSALETERPVRASAAPNGPVPPSFAQERLWFLAQFAPESPTYHVPLAVHLQGAVDAEALQDSLRTLANRHAALRTALPAQDGRPMQVVAPAWDSAQALPFTHIDLRTLPAAERVARTHALVQAQACQPFDLTHGPLWRAALICTEDDAYTFVLVTHHLISDGWSQRICMDELARLYRAARDGTPAQLSALPLAYTDYALWQRAHMQGARLEAQLAYWRAHLDGAPELLELPTDRPRPALQDDAGAVMHFSLPAETLATLHRLSQGEGVTLFMTTLAAFQWLLYRYTGQRDIVIGTPIAGRTHTELEGLLGLFVNTLALRTELRAEMDVHGLLARVRETALGAYAHQDVPFEQVVEAVRPARALSHTPVFQVMFVFHQALRAVWPLAGTRATALPVHTGTAPFDLTLVLDETETGLSGELEYSTALFDAATIARLATHYATLLHALAHAAPATRLHDLALLPPSEGAQLHAWRTTGPAAPWTGGVLAAFHTHAQRTPDAPALTVPHEACTLTYAELDRRTNQLARALQAHGIRAERVVAISLPRSSAQMLAVLATLKAGGAYLPLDPAYPPERRAWLCADARVSLTLAAAAADDVLAWETLVAESATLSAAPLLDWPDPAQLAYVIYTSGSTGTPKGVGATHAGLANLSAAIGTRIGITPEDKILQFASLSFDAAAEELYGAWTHGAALVLRDEDALASFGAFEAFVVRAGVSVLDLPTAYWQAWAGERAQAGRAWLACVRAVIIGGERATAEALRAWQAGGAAGVLENSYGPTEATVTATAWRAGTGTLPGRTGGLPIGVPLAGVRAHVLDAQGAPVPVGVVGELCLGGAGVTRGYLGRPELTAERFVPNAFAESLAETRLYRTGDFVRWLADGQLEYVGRADQQVKVRGFRIELGEVEAVLAGHAAVREAVVVVQGARLVAYVAGAEGATEALLAHARARLPEYMVPSAVVWLAALPLTRSGKVDRGALPAVAVEEAPEVGRWETVTEELVGGIWAEVLGLAEVPGPGAEFFALGGHSLAATQVLSRVRGVLGAALPVRALFEAPGLRAFAQRVEAARGRMVAEVPLVPQGDVSPPLSFGQERLWFLDQLSPGSAAYNLPEAWRIQGALDISALQAALHNLIQRHAPLRTCFVVQDGEPRQSVLPADASLPVAVYAALDWAEAERLAGAFARVPFELTRGPLVRAALWRVSAAEHLLALVMHHAVSDGWSSGVLVRELGALYAAELAGVRATLPALPVQYGDYAAWQRAWLGGADYTRQLDYWRTLLAGALPVLELPADRPRPAVQSTDGAHLAFSLPADLLARLRALSQRAGVTLFMTLLAAFDVLLYRYTGQTDLLVGVPVANRTQAELEGLIGFFVNTLVMRTDLSGAPRFTDLLARVRETTLGAYAHQALPFERVVEAVQPERDLSRSAVFQVMFTLEDTPERDLRLPGATTTPLALSTGTTKFDLSLSLAATADSACGDCEYSTVLFEPATIARLVEHFHVLLAGIVADPTCRVHALPLMTATERAQVLVGWNQSARPYAQQFCLHELVETQVARTPQALALRWDGGTLTYATLNALANRWARFLQARGIGPDVRVAVCMERSPELVIALLAVLKAGGAYVPLDPAYPPERLDYMLADARAALVLSGTAWSAALASAPCPVVEFDRSHDLSVYSDENLPNRAAPLDGAYVIYTSGSTGKPKGVLIPHLGIINHIYWKQEDYPVGPGDRILQKTALSFDASVWEFWTPLCMGAELVLARPGSHRDPHVLAEQIVTWQITLMQLVPSQLRLLLDEPAMRGGAALKRMFCGGEALAGDLAAGVAERWGIDLVNMYGPAEASIDSTAWVCQPEDARTASVPIGRPVSNVQVYVLDAQMDPQPIGVPGELYVGGAALARGYLGRPDLTAERFVPNPFSNAPARLYRTGDLARWRADGAVEFLGRLDHQVKLRGQRIELGEIEAALREHPAVQQAVVLLRRHPTRGELLAAYVASAAEDAPDLRAFLNARLPDYMVPALFVSLPALPQTPNGKLDRRALPAPDWEALALSTDGTYVAPHTPLEELLAGLWAEALGVARVGVQDNFFALGGHSLLAARLCARIRQSLQLDLPLRVLFEHPTVAGLARHTQQALSTAPETPGPAPAPATRGDHAPLSLAQQRLWFLAQLEPESAAYHIPLLFHARGAMDSAALERALNDLAMRHEALRTVFRATDAGPVQVVLAEWDQRLARYAVSAHGAAARAVAEAEARHVAGLPFDLARGPLWHAALWRLSATEHLLLCTFHHLVFDGQSRARFLHELAQAYAARCAGDAPSFAPLALQYADYALWQRAHMQGARLEAQLAYWRAHLDGAPELLELPTDRPRPAVQSDVGATYGFALPSALLADLRTLSQHAGVTLFMTTLAAFQWLLYRYTGQRDIVVGTPSAGRTHTELEALIGVFVNTLVLRTELHGDWRVSELLAHVRESALNAYAHQDVPFEQLVEAVQPQRSLSHTPLFQVMFSLQKQAETDTRLGADLTLEPLSLETGTAAFDLTLALVETETGLSGELEYSTALFDAATIARLATHYQTLLHALAHAAPATRLHALALLPPSEGAQLHAWRATGPAAPWTGGVLAAFHTHAMRTPDAPALTVPHEACTLTYAELDRRTNQLARALQVRAIHAERVVAISLPRSSAQMLAVLATLKAGGAYLPLDPAYPPERRAWLCADARVSLTLAAAAADDVLAWETLVAESATLSAAPLLDWPDPAQLAYVIYTSGSTGTPKGVGATHAGLANLSAAIGARIGITPEDKILQFASLSFDAAAEELYGAWTHGAVLVLRDEDALASFGAFEAFVVRAGVSVLDLPTAYWQAWAGERAQAGRAWLACVRAVIIGGERATAEALRAWQAGGAAGVLENSYGPTEATVTATAWRAGTGTLPGRTGGLPIGVPLAGVRAHVLDAQGAPVPVGVVGELCLGGAGVTRGYLGRPELTAERFVPNAFAESLAETRLYRTGDFVRWLADGQLEYVGRADQQVKVRGFRIELGEVEAVLAGHAAVREAVVVVQGARLVAYVAGAEGATEALLAHARARLPEYMVPSAVVWLAALPLTRSGKVDRGALPAVALEAAPEVGRWETVTEELVGGIWAEVLGLAEVPGPGAEFFVLGGHSLAATQVLSRVRGVLGAVLPVRALFEAPGLRAFAQRVEAARGRMVAEVPLVPQGDVSPPLSFGQERLWFLDQLSPGSAAYHIVEGWHLRGALDVTALERALNTVLARHTALRMYFANSAGVPQLRRWPTLVLALTPEPLADEAALAQAVHAELRQPFALNVGPLVRARLWRTGAEAHTLVLVLHHAVSDGWSSGVLARELSACYAAYLRGAEPALAPLPVQYGDYAAWQRAWLRGPELERQMAYWRACLGGELPVLELPTDRPRPAVRGERGASYAFTLAPALAAHLRALSRRQGATLFMTLLAAFDIWLYRHTAQTDIIVGTPVANRTRAELEGLIGFFANTLALRVDLTDAGSFHEVLRRVREATLDAHAHQDMPFEQLVEALQPERSLAHTPIFQVSFVFQAAPAEDLALPGLSATSVQVETQIAKHDLGLALLDTGQALLAELEYAADLFEPETIARMAAHFETLLASIVADPTQAPAALEMLTPAERHTVLAVWPTAAPVTAPDAQRFFHARFEAQAAAHPDAEAVCFVDDTGTTRLTYAALNRRANQLARTLRKLGARPETRVSVCLDRSPDVPLALLATLKAGAAYMPLDPAYPPERLALMLQDAALSVDEPPLVITHAHLLATLPLKQVGWERARIVCLDTDWAASASEPDDNLDAPSAPESTAYVIFTSGSTGRPKASLNTQRGLASLCAAQAQVFGIGAGARVLQFAALSFDASLSEIVLALATGAALCMAPRTTLMPGPELADFLRAQAITLAILAPSALANLPLEELPALTFIAVAGEACPPALVERWAPGRRFFNLYGPTEASVWTTYAECEGDDRPPPIGRPVPGACVYVLDAAMRLVPPGVAGELYIGGPALSPGYLHRPRLTAEKFVPNPFADAPGGARLYRTGDLARWRADGLLDFLGRIDHQVKIRGFRIEPGEVEAQLAQHAGVREVLVMARHGAIGEAQLVAYVVADPGEAVDAAHLRRFLKTRLPDYMVPAAFVVLDAFPLTPSGKINRQALPAPVYASADDAGYSAPSTPFEEMVAEVWASVLQLARPSAHANFFELGGHSLLATQVVARLRDHFNIELPVRVLFEAPVLAALAARVKLAYARRAQVEPSVVISARKHGTPLPLSFAQQRLWFLWQWQPDNPSYNIPLALHLHGPLNEAALQSALNGVLMRHEVLQCCYPAAGDLLGAYKVPAATLTLARHDLRARPADAQRLAEAEATRPFDLATDLPLRATLLVLGVQEHSLLLTLHHIAADGWAMGVLVRELSELYAAACEGRAALLPELPVQYADYAAWQAETLQGEALARQLDYWKARLHGAPAVLELPTDHPRPAVRTFRGALHSFALAPELAAAVRACAARAGVTPFMLLLAAFQALLQRYSGQDDIVVGTPIAGRTHSEIEGLIGCFVNTLVLRTQFEAGLTGAALLQRVREATLDAYTHQDLPFEQLVQALQPERDLAHSPLFQVLFAFNNTAPVAWQFPGLTVNDFAVENHTAKFDLTLALEDTGTAFNASITFNADLFEAETARRMAAHWQTLLAALVAAPERRVADLPMLAEDEARRMLEAWNTTTRAYPPARPLHALFEAQAQRVPERIAVTCEERGYSYADLNARANQLARHLQTLGVGPDVPVGVCIERSADVVLVMLGVLKAGGAYVMLDPEYPPERVRRIVAAAGAPVLVTEVSRASATADDALHSVCLERDWPLIAAQASGDLSVPLASANLMYALFTSGSTGQPKGVGVEHRQFWNYLHANAERLEFLQGWHYALVSTFAADLGSPLIWGALTSGGTLHVITRARALDPDALADYFRRNAIDVLKIVPSHWAALQSARDPAALVPRQRLTLAGEASDWEQFADARALRAACRLQNTYGPTETTVSVLAYELPNAFIEASGVVPLGTPMGNTRVYVLDALGRPTPLGVPGELYIGGAGVARGYLGRPDLTAERFVPDPFARTPGQRLYRTGDRVRWNAAGLLEFLGRIDQQVKLRGFRVELGEIEAALMQDPAIQRAAVILREDTPGDKRLAAYLVAAPDAQTLPAHSVLSAHLQRTLPDYMLPASYTYLPALPLSSNGKLERRALPVPQSADAQRVDAFTAPRNALEARIAAVWGEVLGRADIGIDDKFFESGGDSLKAVRVIHKLDRSLAVMEIFKHQTIRALAERLAQQQPVAQGARPLLYELTPAQRHPVLTLICAPGASANAIVFKPLADALPPGYALYAVELPGHDPGHPDETLLTWPEVAPLIVAEIKRTLTGPLAVYGHSAGGALALEIARLLEADGTAVAGVYLGACFPRMRLAGRLSKWLTMERWQADRVYQDSQRLVIGSLFEEFDPQAQAMRTRSWRHDNLQGEDYYSEAPERWRDTRLRAPILSILGEKDRSTEFHEERINDWLQFGTQVEWVMIPQAAHYFLKHQAAELAAIITRQHETWRRTPPGVSAAVPAAVAARSTGPSLRLFVLVAFGQLISMIGTALTSFALDVWVYQQTGSIVALASVAVFMILPVIALLPLAGLVADRWDRRGIMLACDLLAAARTLVLAGLLWSGQLQVWHLWALVAAGSVATAFQQPAYIAAVAQLVPKRYLGHTSGFVQLGTTLGEILAPLLGGLLIVAIGLHGIVLMDMVTYLFAVLTLVWVRFPNTLFRKEEEPWGRALLGGWRYLVRRRGLMAIVVYFAMLNMSASVFSVLLTPLALSLGDAAMLGQVLATFGLGMLLANVVMILWGGTRRRTHGLLASSALYGLSILIAGLRPAPEFLFAGLFGAGAGYAFTGAHFFPILQMKVSDELLGRVLAAFRMLAYSTIPFAYLLAGPLVEQVLDPLMAQGGWLAVVLGAGPGRGMGLALVLAGLLTLVWAALAFWHRPLVNVEDDLPDAVMEAVVYADRDRIQAEEDQALQARTRQRE